MGHDQTDSTTPISQLGYEECRDQLIEVVRLLEQGGLDLETSLKLWERGEKLARRCEEHLAGARQRIEDVLAAEDTEDASAPRSGGAGMPAPGIGSPANTPPQPA
ncbi:hypothetical protein MBOT_23170 [Mycobacterium botniense]|uniref:Exodeoxyribonuclease 7 small subunit n=1 Tax=Mycobacterium botniense TaxID=84962 RepID=A0A7I9XYR1_9MYCO|nr:hypothetical protein MBOT_23170 [Mycobacterium botniense]